MSAKIPTAAKKKRKKNVHSESYFVSLHDSRTASTRQMCAHRASRKAMKTELVTHIARASGGEYIVIVTACQGKV